MLISNISACHLTSAHSRDDIRIFFKQCTSLAHEGAEVLLLVSDGQGVQKRNGVNIVDVGKKSRFRSIRMTLTVLKIGVRALLVKSKIYHFHDPELIPVGLVLKIVGRKVIYDSHEDVAKQILSKYWIPIYLRDIVSYLFNKFEKNSSRFFDAVITATPMIKNRFLGYNSNIEVINNYPLLEEMNTSLPCNDKQKTICYIGGISKIRGIEELIKSLEFTDCKLVLAGNFSDTAFEKKIKTLKGWEKVDYRGMVNREGVYEILSCSMAGVVTFLPLPNHVDAQPNKMFEYMSAGVPVICSHFPLWKQIIDGNKCGLCVDPSNVSEISKAINYVVGHVSESKQMGINGKKAVLEKYNWSKESFKLVSLYENL